MLPSKWLPRGGMPKLLVPFAIAAAGIGLVVVIVNQQQQMGTLDGQLQLSRQHVQQLETQNESLVQQVSSLESDRNGLDARVKALRSELTFASTNLDQSRAALEELQAS